METALYEGTIFLCLNLQFYKALSSPNPGRTNPRPINNEEREREDLMKEIYAVSFALNDLTLYLDTHPDCQKGAGIYHELLKKRLKLLAQFASKFYLLTQFASKFYPLTHLSVITGGCERMNGSAVDRLQQLQTRARRSARMRIRGAKVLLPKFTVIEYTIKGISRKTGDFFVTIKSKS